MSTEWIKRRRGCGARAILDDADADDDDDDDDDDDEDDDDDDGDAQSGESAVDEREPPTDDDEDGDTRARGFERCGERSGRHGCAH